MQQTEDYFVVSFSKNGQLIRILWARKDKALELALPALAERGTLVDYSGRTEAVVAEDKQYLITLDGARCNDECDIGGPPLFLVEDGVSLVDPIAEIQSTPVRATLTATPETSPSFTPWPTDTATPTETPTASPTATVTPSATASPAPSATQTVTITALPSATGRPAVLPTVAARVISNDSETQPPTEADDSGLSSFWIWGVAGVVAAGLIMLLLRTRRSG